MICKGASIYSGTIGAPIIDVAQLLKPFMRPVFQLSGTVSLNAGSTCHCANLVHVICHASVSYLLPAELC